MAQGLSLRVLPLGLTVLRLALAPLVVALACWGSQPGAFAVCLMLALLTDFFDGVLARRLDVATPALRRLDSLTDTAFYLSALFAIWRLQPQALIVRRSWLTALIALELLRYGYDWLKFRREAAYHLWTAKLWRLTLFAACFSLLVLKRDGAIVDAAPWLGLLADGEGLAVSVVLREWRNDVPTFCHAWRYVHAGARI